MKIIAINYNELCIISRVLFFALLVEFFKAVFLFYKLCSTNQRFFIILFLMKKSLFFAGAVTLLLSVPLAAQNKNHHFSITPEVGLKTGTLGEYLYSQYNRDSIVSDLQWHETLMTIGLDAEYSYKKFFVNGSFSYALPFKCGAMYDSDYEGSLKTILSTFENNSFATFDAELRAGYNFSLSGITLAPVFGAKYSMHDFWAKNGYGFFGDSAHSKTGSDVSWDSPEAVKYYVSDITYNRETLYTFTGIKLSVPVNRFSFELIFLFSPYTYTVAQDIHKDNSNKGREFTILAEQNCFFSRFTGGLNILFSFTEKIGLYVSVSLLAGFNSRGIIITNYGRTGETYGNVFNGQNEFYLSKQNSGAQIKELNIKIGTKFLF